LRRLLLVSLALFLLSACATGEDEATTEGDLPTRFPTVEAMTEVSIAPTDVPATRTTIPTNTPRPTDIPPTDSPTTDTPPIATITSTPQPVAVAVVPDVESDLPLERISLPPGFVIHVFADNVQGARSMTRAEDGTIFVGTRRDGVVYALRDTDGDYLIDEQQVIANGLNNPNGVVYHDGALFVAQIDRVTRYDNVLAAVDANRDPDPVLITDRFLDEGHHGWKYMRLGPDGKLYVPQGVPCNVCEESDTYGYVARMNLDGSDFEVILNGMRNTVGFDWHPETGDFWFTDNGRDWMGDDLPPDELNHLSAVGQHFGFPYCHGGTVIDPEFGYPGACDQFRAPVMPLGPHVAALGLRFYDGEQFPAQYHNQAFIAERGSWNRSVPIGYRVTLVRLNGDQAVSYEPFAEGWLNPDGTNWGRPVDLMILPDGSLLVSDDLGGRIYRIVYTG
jgi:glucose/arabinose dehydrogenase